MRCLVAGITVWAAVAGVAHAQSSTAESLLDGVPVEEIRELGLSAQSLEPTATVTMDGFLEQLSGDLILIQVIGADPIFFEELYAYDLVDLFNHAPSPAQAAELSDMIVLIFPTWAEVRDVLQASGLESVADVLPSTENAEPGLITRDIDVTYVDGSVVRIHAMVDHVLGDPLDHRCLARFVIDHTYSAPAESTFGIHNCSLRIQ